MGTGDAHLTPPETHLTGLFPLPALTDEYPASDVALSEEVTQPILDSRLSTGQTQGFYLQTVDKITLYAIESEHIKEVHLCVMVKCTGAGVSVSLQASTSALNQPE